MRSSGHITCFVLASGLLAACSDGLQSPPEQHQALLDRYCVDCHNAAEFTADLALDSMNLEDVAENARIWERVIRKLRGRMMPPPGEATPDPLQVDEFAAWLETRIDTAFPEPDPGHVALHRLNRTEYANAIRDLIALEVDAEELLPVDGAEDGFDNIANALTVSPSFIDQYVTAARTLSDRAIGNPSPRAIGVPYTFASTGQRFHVPGLPLGTRGGALIEHYFPSDGDYLLHIGDLVSGLWGFNQEHVNTVISTLDGRKFFELDIGGGEDLRAVDQIGAPAVDAINARLKNIPFTATAGTHRLGVTFLHRSFAESDRLLHQHVPGGGQDAVLTISALEIFGPVAATGLSDTPSRNKIFSCRPVTQAEAPGCARAIISTLGNEAFRGNLTDDDLDVLMGLYEAGAGNSEFEEGVKYALSGILAHPKFLYRLESENNNPNEVTPLRDHELASRLSFFLWSTIPDAELLDQAAAGRLSDPAVTRRQIRRMLDDPRSETLASNFAFQWLGLGELAAIDPDPALFVDVHRNIRELFITEIRLFVDSILRADRSVLDLLTAEHSYLNESLALHYGIRNIRGERFRRVELGDENRRGLLGKGGVLMVASYPNRTSPVLRGAWLLENVFGTPPTPPPPDVEALVENIAGEAALGVRERLEIHRDNPSCNSCHGVIDPLGFALENFDAVGRWRLQDRESGTAVNSFGVLVDGTTIEGPIELRRAILDRHEQFVQTFVEKLMTYALGRSLEFTDMPTIRRIVAGAAAEDYRFSAIVAGIVESPQFRSKSLAGAANSVDQASE